MTQCTVLEDRFRLSVITTTVVLGAIRRSFPCSKYRVGNSSVIATTTIPEHYNKISWISSVLWGPVLCLEVTLGQKNEIQPYFFYYYFIVTPVFTMEFLTFLNSWFLCPKLKISSFIWSCMRWNNTPGIMVSPLSPSFCYSFICRYQGFWGFPFQFSGCKLYWLFSSVQKNLCRTFSCRWLSQLCAWDIGDLCIYIAVRNCSPFSRVSQN